MPHLTLYGRDYAAKKRATTEAAFSDLKMIQSIAKTMTRKAEIPMRKGPISLNADQRKTEIFRIMKENHRLLDRLENLEPFVSTTELVRNHKNQQRYTILTSHSKRLAGEYDAEVERIRTEDKAQTEAMNRSVQARLAKHRLKQSSSMSAPSLTPLASSDPGPGFVGMGSASPSTKPRRIVRQKPAPMKSNTEGNQTSSSSSSFPKSPTPAVSPEASNTEVSGKRNSKVSFSGNEQENTRATLGSFAATPHHKSKGEDTEGEESLKAAPPPPPAGQVEQAETAAPPPPPAGQVEQAESAQAKEPTSPIEPSPREAKSLKEYGGQLSSASDQVLETWLSTLTPAARRKLEQGLGMEKEAMVEQKDEGDIDPEYKDDFEADVTMDSNSMSKAINSVEDDVFETSKDA
eukprot:CAMPEP_0169235428 /NCGR_PEP_ID=MMETSP1016-20121227/28712_1 /TAXON_ID=342587 /ORGANISM="Karlodinium micrum, Strain CCMP2283" /LENGTH=404 /DNA_ID=CAMNT_0009314973 /DNA_START=229 /DNA_END=1443 /DNA_ORIENTATION=-